jgi:hypothetical protein
MSKMPMAQYCWPSCKMCVAEFSLKSPYLRYADRGIFVVVGYLNRQRIKGPNRVGNQAGRLFDQGWVD